jgi:hypothetical protein
MLLSVMGMSAITVTQLLSVSYATAAANFNEYGVIPRDKPPAAALGQQYAVGHGVEWLHLVAHSLLGITDGAGQQLDAQRSTNMVLGSWNANSRMCQTENFIQAYIARCGANAQITVRRSALMVPTIPSQPNPSAPLWSVSHQCRTHHVFSREPFSRVLCLCRCPCVGMPAACSTL